MGHDNRQQENTGVSSQKGSTEKITPVDYKKLYEQELDKSNRLYLSLFRNRKTIMVMVDPATLHIVDANVSAVNFYGYPYEKLMQMHMFQLNATLSAEVLEKNVKQALRSEKNLFYSQHRLANNEKRDVEVHVGKIDYEDKELLLIIVYDISLKIKAKKELEESEIKFREIFKISPDAITISRIDNGKYMEVNKNFTLMSGYTPEETIGKTSIELGIWADLKDRDRLVTTLIRKGVAKDFKTRFRLKDGKIIHGLISANIFDFNGVLHILSVSRNVEEYVKTNEAMKQSELKFKKVFTISPNSLAITNLETGKYIDINKGFLEETGYTRKEIIGKTARELKIWADYRQRKNLQKALKEKGSVKDMPVNLRMKDGTIVRGLVSSNLIEINGEPHLISISRNIEDFIRATAAYRQSERRYKTLFGSSPAGIILIDDTGTILEANPTYCKNTGYSVQEITGEKIWNIANNSSFENKEQILKVIPTITENKITEKEVVNIRKNGERIDLHLYETRIRLGNNQSVILSLSIDVTKEKLYRKELVRQSARLKEAQDIGRLGSWELNWKTRKLFWSDGIYHILGIDTSQKPNYDDFQRHIHPDELGTARSVLKDSIKTGKGFKYIHRLLTDNGLTKWVIERGKSFYDEKGRVIRTHGTVQDITLLKETEDKLKELNELLEEKVRNRTAELKKKQHDLSHLLNDMQRVQQELRNSNKALQNLNHELETFSYSVSHDLKAPLRAISGFASILKEDYYQILDKEGKVLLDDILSETKQMAEIIAALLLLSRTGRKNLNYVEFDLNPLARSVFTEQQKYFELPHAQLQLDNLSPVYADYNLIKQLMANLLSNALKYSAKEVIPLVEMGCTEDEKTNEPVFYIKDNGVGFDEVSSGKMFDAFQRLHSKKEFEGTGIGLAIAKRIVLRHKGKIWAKSKKGEGTTIFFTLSENEKIN